jgi:hypothetical protein
MKVLVIGGGGRACPSLEAAAVSAGAEDLLRAGEWRHQLGRGVHSRQKNSIQEFTGRGSHPCKERKS